MGQVAKDKIEIGVVLQGGGALGAYEFGIRAFGRGRKQVRDFGKVIDIRLIAAPLPLHTVVTARREFGSFGDKTQAGEHGFTVSLCYRLPFGAPCSLPPCGQGNRTSEGPSYCAGMKI